MPQNGSPSITLFTGIVCATASSMALAQRFGHMVHKRTDTVGAAQVGQGQQPQVSAEVCVDRTNPRQAWVTVASKKALTPSGRYLGIDDNMPQSPKENFLKLKTWAEEGKLRPVVDRIYPLTQMAEAHRYVEEGRKRGSVIVQVGAGAESPR